MLSAIALFLSALVQPAWLGSLLERVAVPQASLSYIVRIALPSGRAEVGLPPVEGPPDASRPLVVIDPGHGGHDPGASGAEGIKEAQLTLALARALRDEIVRRGRVRVALTRDDDRFLALEERSGIARRLDAGLFLSIHADAAGDEGARGATLYTLSERASDAEAARIATRENRADAVNGVPLEGQDDAVAAILLDLSRRSSLGRAARFAGLVVREGQGALTFKPEPVKSAAFVVLKAPDVPSVLFEAGYVSNPDDVARLTDPRAQAAFARSVADAIEAYFVRVRANG
jgi:N-acetylmuramoyl-L-alanine amidase